MNMEELFYFKQSCLSPIISTRISSSHFGRPDKSLDSGAIYRLLKSRGNPADVRAQFIWKNAAPPRVQMFMWLLLQGRIQCRSVLFTKHIVPDKICEVCHQAEETAEHIVLQCHPAKDFWHRLGASAILSAGLSNLHSATPPPGIPALQAATFIALGCWELWKGRNEKVFRETTLSLNQLLANCRTTAGLWKHRLPAKCKQIVEIWCQVLDMARQI